MTRLAARFWDDDTGALIASEYLFVVTILVIGTIIGLSAIRDAINTELGETANALLALSQGYVLSGQSGAGASTDGSEAIDTPSTVTDATAVPAAIPSGIDQFPCN